MSEERAEYEVVLSRGVPTDFFHDDDCVEHVAKALSAMSAAAPTADGGEVPLGDDPVWERAHEAQREMWREQAETAIEAYVETLPVGVAVDTAARDRAMARAADVVDAAKQVALCRVMERTMDEVRAVGVEARELALEAARRLTANADARLDAAVAATTEADLAWLRGQAVPR